jgi:hypothetical protein
MKFRYVLSLFLILLSVASPNPAAGRVLDAGFESESLRESLLGIDPNRKIKVYLPPGYEDSAKRYPVIYYLHNIYWSSAQTFEDGAVQA